ncbi:MAG: DinB family protein [Chloroflexi bacterium]|nr:DinB family protein [Chloroflexota bacterium]
MQAHFRAARNFYQGTIAEVTDAQLLWQPAPVGNPIGAHVGHIVAGEDGLIQGMLRGAAPVGATTWAG